MSTATLTDAAWRRNGVVLRRPGNLSMGSGQLVFDITGRPVVAWSNAGQLQLAHQVGTGEWVSAAVGPVDDIDLSLEWKLTGGPDTAFAAIQNLDGESFVVALGPTGVLSTTRQAAVATGSVTATPNGGAVAVLGLRPPTVASGAWQ